MYAYGKRWLRSCKFVFPFFFFLAAQSEILPVMASRHDIGNMNPKFANDLLGTLVLFHEPCGAHVTRWDWAGHVRLRIHDGHTKLILSSLGHWFS